MKIPCAVAIPLLLLPPVFCADAALEGGTRTWRQIFMDGRKPSRFADC